jgi:S1-C subfamily serine protease
MNLSRLQSSPPRSDWTAVLTAMQLLVIRRLSDPFMMFQLDAVAYPGNSGSPLYDVDAGRVIGVINSVYVKQTKETAISSPSGISYAVPVDYIRALLKKAGVGQ